MRAGGPYRESRLCRAGPIARREEATMFPYTTQYLATERARDLREQASAARP